MLGIQITIERLIERSQPGFVQCVLVDASGAHHLFVEKIPVVSREGLRDDTEYSRPGVVACIVMSARTASDGRELVTVDTELPWGIASTDGRTRFEIFPDQLVEIGRDPAS